MSSLSRDPIINVVHNGIKQGIRMALENQCFAAAVILIYSGMDTMAYLSMPESQQDVTRADFVTWVQRYIHFPCKEQLTGIELYGARCGMLHNYSIYSRLSREGKSRLIGYVDQSTPEVSYNPSVSTNLAIVSIKALAQAFFTGVDKFLIDAFSDKHQASIVEQRLKQLVYVLAFEDE